MCYASFSRPFKSLPKWNFHTSSCFDPLFPWHILYLEFYFSTDFSPHKHHQGMTSDITRTPTQTWMVCFLVPWMNELAPVDYVMHGDFEEFVASLDAKIIANQLVLLEHIHILEFILRFRGDSLNFCFAPNIMPHPFSYTSSSTITQTCRRFNWQSNIYLARLYCGCRNSAHNQWHGQNLSWTFERNSSKKRLIMIS